MTEHYETGMTASDIAAKVLGGDDEETLRLRALEDADNGDTEDTEVHGATMFGAQRMPRDSDTSRVERLDTLLQNLFGTDDVTAPVFTMEEMVFLNEMLLVQAGAILYDATGSPELLAGATLNQQRVLSMAGTSAYNRVEYMQSIGERLLNIISAMQTGKTAGLFIAPF